MGELTVEEITETLDEAIWELVRQYGQLYPDFKFDQDSNFEKGTVQVKVSNK